MASFLTRKRIKVLSPAEGYDRWAASYLQESNPIKRLSDELVEKMLPSLDGKRVLDAGCGPGKFCLYAQTRNALSISGIDLSSKMIDEARRNCPSGNFWAGDLSHMPCRECTYDVVICALVLAHIQQLDSVLEKLIAAMDHGGVMVITDFHPFLTLRQAKRTFLDTMSGKQFEVRHYLHLFEEYLACFLRHRLSIEDWAEPQFDGIPVIFGLRVRKE